MKAEIKNGALLLILENKKDVIKMKKFVEKNASDAIIPKSRSKLAYYNFKCLSIAII